MRAMPDGSAERERTRPLSRQEIETACVLDVVASTGCYRYELAVELGLAPALAGEIARAVDAIIGLGLVAERDGRLSITASGSAWLDDRLAGRAVPPGPSAPPRARDAGDEPEEQEGDLPERGRAQRPLELPLHERHGEPEPDPERHVPGGAGGPGERRP